MSDFPTPPPSALLPNPSSSALLDTTSPHTEFLPPIPELIGIKNVEEWKYAVRVHLNHHALLEFIDGTHEMGQANSNVESPESWRRRRAHAFTILNGKISKVMPALLTAGLKAYDDDYNFDAQELWNYITHYIRMPKREDTLKDRTLLFLFHVDVTYETYNKYDYIDLRQKLCNMFGVFVHPKVMQRLGVEGDELFDDDRNTCSDGFLDGRWITCDDHLSCNLSNYCQPDEFMRNS